MEYIEKFTKEINLIRRKKVITMLYLFCIENDNDKKVINKYFAKQSLKEEKTKLIQANKYFKACYLDNIGLEENLFQVNDTYYKLDKKVKTNYYGIICDNGKSNSIDYIKPNDIFKEEICNIPEKLKARYIENNIDISIQTHLGYFYKNNADEVQDEIISKIQKSSLDSVLENKELNIEELFSLKKEYKQIIQDKIQKETEIMKQQSNFSKDQEQIFQMLENPNVKRNVKDILLDNINKDKKDSSMIDITKITLSGKQVPPQRELISAKNFFDKLYEKENIKDNDNER